MQVLDGEGFELGGRVLHIVKTAIIDIVRPPEQILYLSAFMSQSPYTFCLWDRPAILGKSRVRESVSCPVKAFLIRHNVFAGTDRPTLSLCLHARRFGKFWGWDSTHKLGMGWDYVFKNGIIRK